MRARAVRRSLRDRRGAAIAEFAVTALPFFFLLLGVVELGMIFVANTCLSTATLALSRQIRVGQLVATGAADTTSSGTNMDLADFKAAICARMGIVPGSTCLRQLQVDVRTLSSFQDQTSPSAQAASNFNSSTFCFYTGIPGSVVALRAYYLWTVYNPLLFPFLVSAQSFTTSSGTTSGKFFVLTSTEIFKNEPNASVTNNGTGC